MRLHGLAVSVRGSPVVVLVLASVALLDARLTAQEILGNPWEQLTPGDLFKVEVESTPPAGKAEKCQILISVLGVSKADNTVRLFFNRLDPEKKNEQGRDGYIVAVERASGWPRQVTRVIGTKVAKETVERTSGGAWVKPLPVAFPLEILPVHANQVVGWELLVHRQISPAGLNLEVTYALEEQTIQVKQSWAPGEKWWRTYERSVNGERRLAAKLLNPPARANEDDGSAARTGKPTPLKDARLNASMTIDATNPSLQTLLTKLRVATGLTFEVHDSLAKHDPKFGAMQLREVTAKNVMDIVAHCQLTEGRWDQTKTGYILVADKSLREANSGSQTVFWVVVACLGAVVLGLRFLPKLAQRLRKPVTPSTAA